MSFLCLFVRGCVEGALIFYKGKDSERTGLERKLDVEESRFFSWLPWLSDMYKTRPSPPAATRRLDKHYFMQWLDESPDSNYSLPLAPTKLLYSPFLWHWTALNTAGVWHVCQCWININISHHHDDSEMLSAAASHVLIICSWKRTCCERMMLSCALQRCRGRAL